MLTLDTIPGGFSQVGHDLIEVEDRYTRSQTSIESAEVEAVASALGF